MIGRLIKPLPLHVEEVTALKRNGSNAADLIGSDGASKRDLAGHGSAADDGRLQVELLHHRGNAADVGVFVVGVAAGVVALVLRAVRVSDASGLWRLALPGKICRALEDRMRSCEASRELEGRSSH